MSHLGHTFLCQVKKHLKKTEGNPGGIITMEAPMHVSNVQLIDPVNGCVLLSSLRFYLVPVSSPKYLLLEDNLTETLFPGVI